MTLVFYSCELEDPKSGINASDIIQWTDTNAISIEANGISRTELRIRLGDHVDANQEITFATDQGRFEGNDDKDNPQVYKIKAAGKEVSAILISDVQPNDFVGISASVGGFKITSTVAFTASRPDAVILSVDKELVDADRTDFSTLTLTLLKKEGQGKVSDDIRVVMSKEEAGGVKVDVPSILTTKDGKASFTVKSLNSTPGSLTIKMRVASDTDSIRITKTITFQ